MCFKFKYLMQEVDSIFRNCCSDDEPKYVEAKKVKPKKCPLFYNDPPRMTRSPPRLPIRSEELSKTIAEDQSFEGAMSIIAEISALAELQEEIINEAIALWKNSLKLNRFTKFHPEARAAACVLVGAGKAERRIGESFVKYSHTFSRVGFRHFTYAPQDQLIRCTWLLSRWVYSMLEVQRLCRYTYPQVVTKYPQIEDLALNMMHAAFEKEIDKPEEINFLMCAFAAVHVAATKTSSEIQIRNGYTRNEQTKKQAIEMIAIVEKAIN